jgi:predicted ATP-dependent serine protease
VTGDPGIGKSALLAVARAVAREAGYTVLGAAGVESETHLPFGGVHQMLVGSHLYRMFAKLDISINATEAIRIADVSPGQRMTSQGWRAGRSSAHGE